eukprot:660287-Alexandrium_andersonii.AAC.1
MVFLPKEVDHDAPAACPPPAPPAKHRPLSIAAVVYRAWALARYCDYGAAAAASGQSCARKRHDAGTLLHEYAAAVETFGSQAVAISLDFAKCFDQTAIALVEAAFELAKLPWRARGPLVASWRTQQRILTYRGLALRPA